MVTIDYFMKWAEVESFKTPGEKQMAHFIERNLIYRNALPQHVVADNRVQF